METIEIEQWMKNRDHADLLQFEYLCKRLDDLPTKKDLEKLMNKLRD